MLASNLKTKRKLLAIDSFDLRHEAQEMIAKQTHVRASKRIKFEMPSDYAGASQRAEISSDSFKHIIAVFYTMESGGREHAINLHENVVLVIGREPSCDYVLQDPRASRKHARFLSQISDATQTPYVVCEDTSKAGTFVNGIKVDRRFVLSDGDEVHAAGQSFVLKILEEMLPPPAKQDSTADVATSNPYQSPGVIATLNSIEITDRMLGSGSYAQVFLGYETRSDRRKQVAVKRQVLQKQLPGTHVSVMGELQVLKKIRHPNINSIYDFGTDTTHLYMALELLHSDLFSLISQRGPLQLPSAKFIFFQLMKAVKYLHQLGISHRDIKPENIFLESAVSSFPRVCLGDFGLAHRQPQHSQPSDVGAVGSRTRSFCGTLGYLAPEVLRQYITEEGYDPRALDMWSCGVTFFFALNASHPFDHLAAIPEWGQIWELVRAELIANAELGHDDLMAVSDILSQSLSQTFPVQEVPDKSSPFSDPPSSRRSTSIVRQAAQPKDTQARADIQGGHAEETLPLQVDSQDLGQDGGRFAQERVYIRSIMTGHLPGTPALLSKDPAGQDLLRALLQTKLDFRLTAAQALDHDWFASAQPSLDQMYQHRVLGRGLVKTRPHTLARRRNS